MKFRRHVPPPADWGRWMRGLMGRLRKLSDATDPTVRRGVAVWGGALVGAFVVGYLIAAIMLFPAPLFSASISVPRVLGMPRDAASRVLDDAGLAVGAVETATHPTAARGDVVWQDPPPGVALEEGAPVQLTVSAGPSRIPVPDLAGYDGDLAGRLIQAAGLRVERVDSTQAPVPQGVVVNTRPPAGTPLLPGGGIVMVVSVGAPTITVPDLMGFTPEEAEAILQQVGLTLGTLARGRSAAAPPGTIVEQTPAAGTLAAPGRAVDVTLAR